MEKIKKIKVFLASSNELLIDREKFEIQIYRKCKKWIDIGLFLHLEIWEDLSKKLSLTRSQDEYNKKIQECDLFILLAYTKVGEFSAEEFETAFGNFHSERKPFIFTYFKENPPRKEISLDRFKEKLEKLGHFYSFYRDHKDLWNSFNKELDLLEENGFNKFPTPKSQTASNTVIDSKNVNIGKVDTGGGDFRIGDG